MEVKSTYGEGRKKARIRISHSEFFYDISSVTYGALASSHDRQSLGRYHLHEIKTSALKDAVFSFKNAKVSYFA